MRARFSERARAGRRDWETAFDSLAWEDGAKTGDNQFALFGVNDLETPLHMVDRKFLYGFWRHCFQNRQQLFLVFLRAAPLPVGGALGWPLSPEPPTTTPTVPTSAAAAATAVRGSAAVASRSSGAIRRRRRRVRVRRALR